MRLWHKEIVRALPELQLKSQWRELVLIAKDIHEKGETNHILINRVMDYDLDHFNSYCNIVMSAMIDRGIRVTRESCEKLTAYTWFVPNGKMIVPICDLYKDWHDFKYLLCNMANLYEKHFYAKGKSQITERDWNALTTRYKDFVGMDYKI